MRLRALHRRLCIFLALTAVAAFVSGAGLDAPATLPAAALLLLGLFWQPPARLRRFDEHLWRVLALLLAVRAAYYAIAVPTDLVLPMVDLLLLLLVAEAFRTDQATGEARLYALSFALLIASAAYRPGFVFGIVFVLYVALLTLALTIGQLIRRTRDRGAPEPRLPRRFVLQSLSISSVVLVVSALVFVGFPRVSRGWAARITPPTHSVIGFSDRVSLIQHGGRLYPNPEVVLRVEFPGGERPAPHQLYWRGRSYDRFDGWTWTRSPFVPTPLLFTAHWPVERIEQLIYQKAIGDANVLFGLSPVIRMDAHSRIAPYRDNNGDYAYGGMVDPVYRATSVVGQPPADSLRLANGYRSRAVESYLRLPALPPRIHALADSLAALYDNDYDRALGVRDWLRSARFRYTLELPQTTDEASLEHFLFERRAGHCEYFSTAMAVLLRAMDIPSRNVNGFLGGQWNQFGNYVTVTQNEAHSWVEVWFPRYGWVLFDPTPAGAADMRSSGLGWWAPFRSLFDGVEHRWGKWVLDFDLERQSRMLRRASEAVRGPRDPASPRQVPWRALLIIGGIYGVIALLRLHRPRTRAPSPSAVTRSYLRLRRAYRRAGIGDPAAPPLVFARQLQRAGAPGGEDAAAAIELYARARFGGEALGAAARRELRERAGRARAALRRRGRRAATAGGVGT